MQQPGYKKRYFDTFDAMRFFSFFIVFLGHLPHHYLAIPGFDFLQHSAGAGVKFFFTLSGFLITYIILEEKEQTGKLNLGNFFMRRILKIWPLYYLMLLFAFLTPYILNVLHLPFSNEGYQPNWLASVCFLENYKMLLENQSPNVSPLAVMWSLCVEEHFYIIWGIALYFLNSKRVPLLIIICIVVALVSKSIFVSQGWKTVDVFTNFDTFAYGAIPAYLLVKKKKIFEDKITGIPLIYRIGVIVLMVSSVFSIHYLNMSRYVSELLSSGLFCILFASVITITLPQENELKMGKTNVFSKMGKYTYGLYLYHTIIISLFIQLFNRSGAKPDSLYMSVGFLVLSFLLVLLVSIMSYQLFEVKFLRLKKKF